MILNIGCGTTKISGAWNIDSSPLVGADEVVDIKKFPWALDSNHYEKIYFFHCIEHIEKRLWPAILHEMWRVLLPEGQLVISYPNAEIIFRHWLDNYQGKRNFWEKTIYGRQAYPGDYHVSAVYTPELLETLRDSGFKDGLSYPEPQQEFNTVIKCYKGLKLPTYEELLVKESKFK